MKKFISALLISTLLVSSLTACDSNSGSTSGTSSDDTLSTNSQGTSGTTSEDTSGTTSEDTSSTTSEDTSGETEEEGADNSGLAFPDNGAGKLAKKALSVGTWVAMDIVPDVQLLPNLFHSLELDTELCDEYCFITEVISAQLYRVITVKPSEGNETAVKKALDDYLDAVKTDPNIAFYPGQQECAEGAVSGKTDDGYLYLIIHKDGKAIANEL